MKRRTVKKQFWFSRDEAQDLQKKAKKTYLYLGRMDYRILLRNVRKGPSETDKDRKDTPRVGACYGNRFDLHREGVSRSLRMHHVRCGLA